MMGVHIVRMCVPRMCSAYVFRVCVPRMFSLELGKLSSRGDETQVSCVFTLCVCVFRVRLVGICTFSLEFDKLCSLEDESQVWCIYSACVWFCMIMSLLSIHSCIRRYIHAYIHAYIHTYIHTYTPSG